MGMPDFNQGMRDTMNPFMESNQLHHNKTPLKMENKKKKTQTSTTTTDTAKRKLGNQKLAKRNLKDSTKALKAQATTNRELKYVYPKDCITPDQKKEFRRKTRAALRSFEKKLTIKGDAKEQPSKKELKEISAELQGFKQKVLTHAN